MTLLLSPGDPSLMKSKSRARIGALGILGDSIPEEDLEGDANQGDAVGGDRDDDEDEAERDSGLGISALRKLSRGPSAFK